jgi:hypothetical protein
VNTQPSRTLRHAEGTAEWQAGPENRGVVMSDGRSIRLPSAKFAQVREPGRNGPAVTRFPLVRRGGSNPPLCTRVPGVRIGIAACLRNRCLRVRISPLAPKFRLATVSVVSALVLCISPVSRSLQRRRVRKGRRTRPVVHSRENFRQVGPHSFLGLRLREFSS